MKLTEKIMNALNDECGIRYKSKTEQDVFLFGARRALEEYAKGLWHGADEQPAINSEVIIFAKKVLPSGQRVAPTYAAVYRDVMGRDVCLFTDIDIKADILRWINVEDLLAMNDWKLDVRWRPNTGIIRHEPLMPVPHKNVNLLVTYAEAQQEHEAMMWKKMNYKRRREYGICTALCYLHFMRVEYAMKLARDAVDTLAKRKDMYRHEVKRTCRRIVDEVARLNAWMYNVIQKERYIEGYDHFVDTFSEHMKEKYDALRYCMMQACKPCLTDPALYAQLECTRIVAELADACRKGDMEVYRDYSYIKGIYAYNTKTLIPLLCSLEELIKKRIFIRGSKDVNLNNDEYVCRCVNAVTDRFRDGKGLVKLLEDKW